MPKWQLTTPGLTQRYSAQVSTSDIKGICEWRVSMGKCGLQIIRNHDKSRIPEINTVDFGDWFGLFRHCKIGLVFETSPLRHSIFSWNPQIPKHIKTMPVNVKKSPICVVKGLMVLAVPSKKTSQGRLAGNLLSKVVVPHGQLPSQAHRKGIVPLQTPLKNGTHLTFVFG